MANVQMLPLPGIQGMDDLIATAHQGALAGTALDTIKVTLTTMRDKKYRELLNATEERTLTLKHELKAIEGLAQALLAKEAQGELAHQHLMQMAGARETHVDPVVLAPEKTPARKRPARVKRITVK